jgi:pimeloyl-ACP methyl ester carboxylesterase
MNIKLDHRGGKVKVGRAVFRTPGLAGTVKVYKPAAPGTRAARGMASDTLTTLEKEGMVVQNIYEISNAREVKAPASTPTRSTAFGEPAMEFTVPGASPDWAQLVLYKDETGFVSWHFPESSTAPTGTRGAGGTNTYVIGRAVQNVPPEKEDKVKTRGVLGILGKKVLQVLAFKLFDKIVGEVGPFFVKRWEEAHRVHRFRPFRPGMVEISEGQTPPPVDWSHLLKGRALLMLHGTFSTAENAFAQLPPEVLGVLDKKYNGRVFAFEHPTMSAGPEENLAWFIENIPNGASLDLDIISHSRGGLVARLIAEKLGKAEWKNKKLDPGTRRIKVNRLVFVAAPNSGTLLADMKYVKEFIDCYTNLLSFLPPNLVTGILKAIIAMVKQLAVKTVEGLDGIQAMAPGGRFLKFLNDKAAPANKARYYAMASNYEPLKFGIKMAFDSVLDKIFNAGNDLVVPTEGVYKDNGSPMFPVTEKIVYTESDGVTHTGFFAKPGSHRHLLKWLE